MKVDIYAGEEQPLTIGFVHPDGIEIVTEKNREPC
jgi:hypothetical protein